MATPPAVRLRRASGGAMAMPVYEYECAPCRVIYEMRQRRSAPPLQSCPRCGGTVTRLISACHLNLNSFSSPTEAKYAKMSPREEVAKERELQKVYERIWLPPPVKHNPWED
jgi:putative FmdB family regulatory protein